MQRAHLLQIYRRKDLEREEIVSIVECFRNNFKITDNIQAIIDKYVRKSQEEEEEVDKKSENQPERIIEDNVNQPERIIEDDVEYEVKKIKDWCPIRGLFCVEWCSGECTWEPFENLTNAQHSLNDFLQKI